MFFDQFDALCKQNNTTPTQFVINILHLSSSKVTAWKSGSIPKYEILNQIADYFNVTVGYLFDGEMAASQNEKEMLALFSQFTEREQIKIIGKIEDLLAEKKRRSVAAQNQANIQTAYVAARSSDNHPPKTVIGNFSDIENAPDVTDEY